MQSIGADRRETLILGLASLSALITQALADPANNRTDRLVRLIVPRAAGGVTDVVARYFAERASPQLGNVVILNMGGAGGSIGTMTAARAQADGRTLLLAGTSDIIINPVIMNQVAASRNLTPVAILAHTVSGIVINPSVPAGNLAELVAFVKVNPGKLSYASPGSGTVAHLGGELFKQLAGVPDLVHVPYRSAPAMLADLSAGHVSIGVGSLTDSTIALHKEGKIRILVAAAKRRLSAVPDVPTSAEAGYPKLIALLFLGLFVPAGLPAAATQQLSDLVRRIMAEQEFQHLLVNQGFAPVFDSSPEDAAKLVRDEYDRFEPLVRSLGLTSG